MCVTQINQEADFMDAITDQGAGFYFPCLECQKFERMGCTLWAFWLYLTHQMASQVFPVVDPIF